MGDLKGARRVLDEMPERNEVSWSTMIARYDQNGHHNEAIGLFGPMLDDGCKPNIASAALGDLQFGTQIHSYAIKIGFESNVFNVVCWNSMVAGYSSDGRIEEAEQLFELMPARNIASWNAIISGYAQNELFGNAVELFDAMLASGQRPSLMTFSSVLHACANLSSLEKGRSVHAKIVKLGVQREVFMGTALSDMYAKSGDIESCKRVFSRMAEKNEVSWTAMIQGFADNGLAKESILLFEEMTSAAQILPNEQTFLSVLFACSHCGLVDEAFRYFDLMQREYGVSPKERHYTCMVDLLARAGRLREAEEFLRAMPIKPEANSWAALLSACAVYGNEEIGERASTELRELEKENTAGYVLLSNMYASCRKWKDAAQVRRLMKGAGLKKGGGCSRVQIRDEFHTFFSWDVKHFESSQIYEVLELLMWELTA
ncbi:Pentatricopeptide repeat-containing protein, mitochondrial [Ananas comosus]|uniref:Pentatricopeptide repeat-containing protein, mitochondrial n=1 Tax=Ananas comosus TaxID=4615 RepID=A0A199VN37_ANACO|nr:Pentatricopeptide repeat-containing protein, mitochondrial [Ananas comosus]